MIILKTTMTYTKCPICGAPRLPDVMYCPICTSTDLTLDKIIAQAIKNKTFEQLLNWLEAKILFHQTLNEAKNGKDTKCKGSTGI